MLVKLFKQKNNNLRRMYTLLSSVTLSPMINDTAKPTRTQYKQIT